jgi:hypothetical protein
MPRSARLLVLAVLVAAGVSPATAGSQPVAQKVAPGYDLFFTPEGGGRIAVDARIAGVTVMEFRGRPLGTFDFGRHGTHRVGATDTIVRRLDTATPANPKVRIELVGLLLESTNVPGYYVTPQSIRPLGLPSTGTLTFGFDRRGHGGALRSELQVNYDVRHGSPTGPIVATGTTTMGFVAEDVVWLHSRAKDKAPQSVCVPGVYCLTVNPSVAAPSVCHTFEPIPHLHCVGIHSRIPLIDGVNHRLNGRDTSADFHAVGTGTRVHK